MIYILTGDIRTGKTSALLNWINSRNDVDGLLCPDNEKGKRYFLKVKSQKKIELEVDLESEETISIGPYKFLKSAFDKANDFLILKAKEDKSDYLIIDELGKLELKNQGLHNAAKTLIPDFMYDDEKHLILVIRTNLLNEILGHYTILNFTLLQKEELDSI
jgi:nucleoside-triphosphatase THEP1